MTTTGMPVALVLSSGMNGLGAVRALAERGVQVVVIAESEQDIALHSRYPIARYVLEHRRQDAGVDELSGILAGLRFERSVLIPTTDWFVAAIRSPRLRIPDGCVAVAPEAAHAQLLLDKAEETARIGEILPIPRTLTPLPEQPETMLEQLRLPIIVKPRSFAHMCLGAKNVVLRTPDDVHRFYERFPDVRDRVVAQEVIEGPDENLWVCHAVFDGQGELVSAFTFRRLRLSPPHYGVTSYAVSETNREVIELVARLGRVLRYAGPAMVEFKWDPRDGTYRYIELNPRLGLAHYLDAQSSAGTAYVSYRLAAGLSCGELPKGQADGVVFVSLYEDVYSRRLDGERPMQILRDYLRMAAHRHVFAYWSWRDPWPAMMMAWRHGRGVGGSLLAKLKRRAA